jgi:hypothetical protein
MEEQYKKAFEIISKQEVNGCITGSYMLTYDPSWNQDIDIFCYDIPSFNKLLFFMHYNDLFQILDPLENHKFSEYINNNQSSLEKLGLITIKFKYNLCVDINIVYKKYFKTVFDVISSFDMDLIAIAYDIQTQKTISVRETEGKVGTWNKWNTNFYKKSNFWSCKRLLRQFERVVKYTNRGYDVSLVTDKYIELIEEIISMSNFYKTEKGEMFFNNTIEEFKIILKILQSWKINLTITEDELKLLKTIY